MHKHTKKIAVLISFIVITFFAITAHADPKKASTWFPKDFGGGVSAQVMTPPAVSPVVTISAASSVDVSGYSVVMFSVDMDIYWGADSTNTWPYIANTPLGIPDDATTIHVSAACKILVMRDAP